MDIDAIIRQVDATLDTDQALRMTGSQKLHAGGEMFDEVCRRAFAEIRQEQPGISEGAAMAELRRQIAASQMWARGIVGG